MTLRIPTPLARLLVLAAALAALLEPMSPAQAGVSPFTYDRFLFNNGGSVVTHGGTTYAPTIALPTDKVMRVRAIANFSSSSASHLQYGGSLVAEGVFQNSNGTLSTVLAAANNANPINTSTNIVTTPTFTGEFVEADNHTNLNGINSLTVSTSGTNVVVTFQNSASAIDVYVTIYVETYASGST